MKQSIKRFLLLLLILNLFWSDHHINAAADTGSSPQIDMFVTRLNNKIDSVSLGEQVKWLIQADMPADMTEYRIMTALNEHLIFDSGSVEVHISRMKGSGDLIPDEHFTISMRNHAVQMQLTDAGVRYLKEQNLLNHGWKLQFTFQTTFYIGPKELVSEIDDVFSSSASLQFADEKGMQGIADVSEMPYIYTGGFRIQDADGENTQPLEGAIFQIYDSLEDAENGSNPIINVHTKEKWEVITDNDGSAGIYGLSYGKPGEDQIQAEATYYLVEMVSPAGYQRNNVPIPVKVNQESAADGNHLSMESYSDYSEPAMGGLKTFLYLILAGGIIFIVMTYIRFRN